MSHNDFPSLEEFKSRLKQHRFSISIYHDMMSGFPSTSKEELLAAYAQAQRTEARMIFPDAWYGGDEYMKVLGEAQAEAVLHITKEAIRNEPKHYLEVKVFGLLDPELQEFIEKLSHHDWYYDYSDDGNVARGGQKQRDEIDALLKKGGDEYKFWYNKFKPDNFKTL